MVDFLRAPPLPPVDFLVVVVRLGGWSVVLVVVGGRMEWERGTDHGEDWGMRREDEGGGLGV